MTISRAAVARRILGAELEKLSSQEREIVEHFIGRRRVSRNLALEDEEKTSFGQRLADRFAAVMGSWPFIIIQSILLAAWVTLNIIAVIDHWDPYPFILLNLALSFQAAYAAPIIMMSQNRQSEKDRIEAKHDYEVNIRAELEIAQLQDKINELRDTYWKDLVNQQHEQIKMLRQIVTQVCGPETGALLNQTEEL